MRDTMHSCTDYRRRLNLLAPPRERHNQICVPPDPPLAEALELAPHLTLGRRRPGGRVDDKVGLAEEGAQKAA
jgi:hypothetical protein